MPDKPTHAITRRGINWLALVAVWALVAAAFIVKALLNAGKVPLLLDTDDAMRLTEVHDFLNGQAWYDLVQHRLNTPFGASIHWSRLVDLPEATLLLILRPLAGPLADTLLAYLWPLLLLLALLALTAKLALRLGGPASQLAAMILPAFSVITMVEFVPGRLDHHSSQILLTLLTVWCSIEAVSRPRFAIGAALAIVTAIAIGIEGLPMLGAAILLFGLLWVATPQRADSLRLFGAALASGAVLQLLIALPPERWFTPACDALSIVYVGVCVIAGIGFVVLSFLPLATASWRTRLGVGALAGALVIALSAWLFPDCLKGPYSALDPWLVTHWLDRIAEAEPWWKSFLGDPTYPLAVTMPALLALLFALWMARRGRAENRGEWLVYFGYLIIAMLVMGFQIRAARVATSLAIPAGAVLIGMVRHRYLTRRGFLSMMALVGAWIGFAGIGIAVLANLGFALFPTYLKSLEAKGQNLSSQCLMPSAFAGLSAMPPERLMTPIDLGSHMLLFTPHAVVAAPYHRNQQGVRDAFRFFDEPIEQARTMLDSRGVSLVVICPTMPEVTGLVEYSDDSFVALYAKKALPDWLVPVPNPGSPLEIFAVAPRP